MPRKKTPRRIPDWISRPQNLSAVELTDLRQLEDLLDREYSLQDMRRQQKHLLAFLGRPQANFHELQTDRDASARDREKWLRPLSEWIGGSLQHFPGYVAIHVRVLQIMAAGYATFGAQFDRADPLAREWGSRIWQLLADYERLLRLKCLPPGAHSIRHSVKKTLPTFPAPPGAHWGHVRIRTIDDERASIKVRGEGRIFTYAEMGMVDRRSGTPTKLWKLLCVFAHNHGELTPDKPDARREYKKRKEDLDKALRTFFRVEEPAFRLTDDRKGWRARFDISVG